MHCHFCANTTQSFYWKLCSILSLLTLEILPPAVGCPGLAERFKNWLGHPYMVGIVCPLDWNRVKTKGIGAKICLGQICGISRLVWHITTSHIPLNMRFPINTPFVDTSSLSQYTHVERSTATINARTRDTSWLLVLSFLIVTCFYANI